MTFTKDKNQTQLRIKTSQDIYELLKKTRTALAKENGVSPWFVAKDNQLLELVRHHPTHLNEFMGIAGFNKNQTVKYGPTFIRILQEIKRTPSS